MSKKTLFESTLERFGELSEYNAKKMNENIEKRRTPIKEEKDDKFAGTDLFENTRKRIANLMEFTEFGSLIDEDDKEQDGAPDGGGMPPMGDDPNAMGNGDPNGGGMPPMGDDPNAMGGEDPNGGGMPPMGGDPNAMGGGDPNGQEQQGPEGFNPQVDDEMGGDMPPMDDGMGGDPNGGMQPDDEVVDITELTDTQEETEHKVEKLGDKFDKVFKAIGKFEELLRQNDEKIEKLSTEFEKRNPTQIEKLSMQTDKSYPFNVTPSDFWKNKEATSNYSTEYDNNGKEQGQYAITANDIKGAVDWKNIADSLDDDDFIYNQTLDGILKI